MFRNVKNAGFPAEFYWDDVLLIYKRGKTASIVELNKPLDKEKFKHHFLKLFGELLKNHKGDELVQVWFFRPDFDKLMEQKEV